jgi:hypothetical protein
VQIVSEYETRDNTLKPSAGDDAQSRRTNLCAALVGLAIGAVGGTVLWYANPSIVWATLPLGFAPAWAYGHSRTPSGIAASRAAADDFMIR